MSLQLIKVRDLSKSFGPLQILDEVTFTISKGDRFALVGENGTGKTTFAKILLGQESSDSGSIERSPHVQIGYLPQDISDFLPEATIESYLMAGLGDITSLQKCMRLLEEKMGDPDISPSVLEATMSEWNALHEKLELKGAYAPEHFFSEVLKGLELDHFPLTTPLSSLSGGERTRVALAALLLSSPELLILDEPTNHLDIRALEWLETYLCNYKGSLLLISHDRLFINRVVNKIVELSKTTCKFTVYGGNYEYYLEEKKREKERLLKEYEEKKEEIASLRELVKAKTFAKAQPPPVKDRNIMAYDKRGERHIKSERRIIEQAKSRLEELEKEPLKHPFPKTIKGIYFSPKEISSSLLIEFSGLSKSYSHRSLFKEAEGTLLKGDRIVLTGANGSGKSTLFKILLGLEKPDSGNVKIAPSVVIGYLDQHLEQSLSSKSVYEEIAVPFGLSETDLRSELHKSGLLTDSILGQSISSLSLGQKKKLQILKLMLSKSNVLLLDEPTNHLDLKTLENFEEALAAFPGAMIAISHDRWFNQRIATKYWNMEKGKLIT